MTTKDDAAVRAFNAGIEAMRDVARRERTRCRDHYVGRGCRGVMYPGMMAACKTIEDAGETLLRDAPDDMARGPA